jgi:CubicO group peptidase (beta-lactamase class C family)
MSDWKAFEAFVHEKMAAYAIPGLSVAVAKDGELVYGRGFGHRDAQRSKPVTLDTVFGVGSITKSFTCLAIQQLAEEGRLSLSDPVVHHLPSFRTPDPQLTEAITIEHLMTHSAGLPPLPTLFFALMASLRGDPAAAEVVKRLESSPQGPIETGEAFLEYLSGLSYERLGPPGRHFSYSNDGYALLGLVIERTSGQSYGTYVRDRILGPAGMTRATLDARSLAEDPDVTTLFATRPGDGGDEVYAAPVWWEAPAMASAGFLRASARDMLRYLEVFRTRGRVGSAWLAKPESVEAMMQPRIRCGAQQYYGYGLMTTPDYHGVTLVEHGGAIKGVAAEVMVVPEAGITAVGLANLAGVPIFQIVLGAVNHLMGLPVDTPRVRYMPVERSQHWRSTVAGRYASPEGTDVRVAPAGDALTFEIEGKRCPAWPAVPPDRADAGDGVVVRYRGQDVYAEFLRRSTGEVYAMHFGYRIVPKVEDEPLGGEASGPV